MWDAEKNVGMGNYLSKWGLQILIETFFDKMYILCVEFKYWKSKIQPLNQNM